MVQLKYWLLASLTFHHNTFKILDYMSFCGIMDNSSGKNSWPGNFEPTQMWLIKGKCITREGNRIHNISWAIYYARPDSLPHLWQTAHILCNSQYTLSTGCFISQGAPEVWGSLDFRITKHTTTTYEESHTGVNHHTHVVHLFCYHHSITVNTVMPWQDPRQ